MFLLEERVESGPPFDAFPRERTTSPSARTDHGRTAPILRLAADPATGSGATAAPIRACGREPSQFLGDEVGERPGRPQVGSAISSHGSVSPWRSNHVTDPANVALQERGGVSVLLGVDGLREVDQVDLAVPHEHVVGREVAVHDVAIQQLLECVVDPYQIASTSSRSSTGYSCKRGAGVARSPMYVIKIASSVRSIGLGTGAPTSDSAPTSPTRGRPTGRLAPRGRTSSFVPARADASLLDELAVAIELLVAEVPLVQGVVQLQRDQRLARGARVRAAQVNAGLFPLFQRREDRLR